jgi:hypothetical protein
MNKNDGTEIPLKHEAANIFDNDNAKNTTTSAVRKVIFL